MKNFTMLKKVLCEIRQNLCMKKMDVATGTKGVCMEKMGVATGITDELAVERTRPLWSGWRLQAEILLWVAPRFPPSPPRSCWRGCRTTAWSWTSPGCHSAGQGRCVTWNQWRHSLSSFCFIGSQITEHGLIFHFKCT